MSDSFQDREKSFEAKFKLEGEMLFKAQARRNKYLGLWAAEKMGMTDTDAAAYARTVVISDLEEVGDEDVIRKVMGDFKTHNVTVSEASLRTELERLMGIAIEEVKSDFDPLGSDHN
ncbi:DUF1476 domain-containing protein [Magnetovibrio blakemorei]|uniref:Aldolase n=1 Tax=Magnetovibrio blakemorei TaxID=28181 RepID=A0A1E5Q828_9PROT|nr:DUF1476 domain-containing protein [Magnetovibrio blakemorei]OEJ67510.1 aldolase [Magnetovibrio blakemorei]